MEDHVHDCTGPDLTCPCGYVLHIPPICFSVDVYDASRPEAERTLVNEGFNCDDLGAVIDTLREIADKLEKEF